MTILKELWTKEISDPELRSTCEYVVNLRERLEWTCGLVKRNMEQTLRKQAKICNRSSKFIKLQVGE
jgi:hypothetical protein